jgi:hypothetical protein
MLARAEHNPAIAVYENMQAAATKSLRYHYLLTRRVIEDAATAHHI